MPFENGSFSFTAFRLPKALPDDADIVARLSDYAAKKLDTVMEEEQVGWVSRRYLIENELDETNVCLGRYALFTLRTALRKIPSALLKAECSMRELQYLRENALNRVPAQKRKEIKEDIIRMRLPQMPPSISGVQIAIDRPNSLIWVGSGSGKVQKTFIQLFQKTFDMEPELITLGDWLMVNLKKLPSDLIPLTYGETDNTDLDFPGRDFLTWLWFYSESTMGGELKVDRGSPAQLALDGPLSLVASAEGRGAGEVVISKGMPTQSAEAKAALTVGKKLRKAKIMVSKDEPYMFKLDADRMIFSGVVLPEADSMDEAERFDDRMERTFILFKVIEAYFCEYAQKMTDPRAAEKLKAEINQWILTREGF